MTVTAPSEIATDDHSAEPELSDYEHNRACAEDFLAEAGDAVRALDTTSMDQEHIVVALLARAQVGTGFAKLAAIDWAREQANQQASLAGQVLAEFRAIVAGHQPDPTSDMPTDFLIDSTDDQWTHTGNGLYESKQDPGLFDVPVDHIRQQWGPVREYVLRPPRPAD